MDKRENSVKINIRRTPHLKKHLKFKLDRLSRAQKKIEKLIYDASTCERIFADLVSYLLVLATIGICAIPVIPGVRDSLQEKWPEDATTNTALFIYMSICLSGAAGIQFLNHCLKRDVVLTHEQDEQLIDIIKRCPLRVTWKLYPNPHDAIEAIANAKNQIERQCALYGLRLFDNKSIPISNVVCDYLKEPVIHCKT